MKRVVIASDSFKGSLSSAQVADSIEQGLKSVCPDIECIKLSVADGGEGTVEALMDSLGGELIKCRVHDPLMRLIDASYVILGDGKTALLEMATASGLPLLAKEERNPLKTSTFGTGELIADALDRGCTSFLLGLGGSATNDGGMGCFEALGYRFLDSEGKLLRGCGENLCKVSVIDSSSVHPLLLEASFTVACDVDTPFCGPKGAAFVFAPQKGANPQQVQELDRGLAHFAEVIKYSTGRDISQVAGSGAAGGLGGGLLAFSRACLKPGIEMVLEAIGFDRIIEGADAVITGEGRIDFQTFKGKTPFGVMSHAAAKGIPVYAIGGCVDLSGVEDSSAFKRIVPAVSGEYDLEYVMRTEVARSNVASAAASLAEDIFEL